MLTWNRTDQSLPEDDSVVLIYLKYTDELFLAYRYVYADGDYCWKEPNGDDFLFERGEVTHWAEVNIPEP